MLKSIFKRKRKRINSQLFFFQRRVNLHMPAHVVWVNAVVNIPSVCQTPSMSANPIKSWIEEQSRISLYGHDRYFDFMVRRAPRAHEKLSYSKRVLYFTDFFRYSLHANSATVEKKLRLQKIVEKRFYIRFYSFLT